ncbi:hypothetical protein IJH15_01425 [Candidatus Saccharibacteria bacterium]|nr:hypothetical protein [Candidatus Saccharibacteria bacterium]
MDTLIRNGPAKENLKVGEKYRLHLRIRPDAGCPSNDYTSYQNFKLVDMKETKDGQLELTLKDLGDKKLYVVIYNSDTKKGRFL